MKKLVVVLSVALLGAGIGAVYLWQELDDLRSQAAALQARVSEMETLKPAAPTLTAQVQGADTAAVPTVAAPLPVAKEAPSPAVSDMQRTMMRAALTQLYPDLGQELDLRPDELEKLLDLLSKQRTLRAANAADPEGDKAVAAMLGNKYPLWQEYQQTLPGRQQVTQLRGQLAASGSALPEAQVRPLMAALTAEEKRIDEDQRKNPPPRITSQQEQMDRELQRATENNRRLVEVATPYLSAPQLDSYRQMLERQTSMVRTIIQSVGAMQEPTRKQN